MGLNMLMGTHNMTAILQKNNNNIQSLTEQHSIINKTFS